MTAQIIPSRSAGRSPSISYVTVRHGSSSAEIMGWLHSNINDAIDDAAEIADGFAVQVKVNAI